MSTLHTKKVFSRYYEQILSGEKTYEIRLADWECKQGDMLHLVEINDNGEPTGRKMSRKVGAVIRTKDIEQLDWWSKEDIASYGYQVIALREEVSNEG